MISEILGKALIVVKADTSQAKAAIKDLKGVEKEAAEERVKAQEKVNTAWDNALKKHALVVAGVSAGIGIAISSVKKYEEHLKALGDTGSGELVKIQRASEAAAKAQDNLQIALGRIVVAALPVVEALAGMAQELANIADGVSRVVAAAAGLGGGRVGSYLSASWKWGRRLTPGLGQLSYGKDLYDEYLGTPDQSLADTNNMRGGIALTEGESYQDESRESVSPAMAKALGWVYVSSGGVGFWRPPTDDEKRAREAKRKAGARAGAKQADIYADAWRAISGEIGVTSGAARGDGSLSQSSIRDFTGEELLGAAGAASRGGDFDQFGSYEDIATERIAASMKAAKELADSIAQRESLLESIFGPVEEFDLYTTAWQGLETVVSAGFAAWIDGSKSVGAAMKEALHGFARSLASEALMQALRHTAYGIGSLAIGGPLAGASAGAHFKAAAAWGGVAVLAGGISRATTASGNSVGSNANAAAGIGGGRGGGGGGMTSLTVVMGDQFAGDSPRYVARRVRRNMELARQYVDYEEED